MFAALSYAITHGSGGSQATLAGDQARLTADEIIEYGSGLRPVADRMLLAGLSDNNSPAGTGLFYDNPTGTEATVAGHELFDPAGGNVPYMTPPTQACNSTCAYTFTGQITVTGVGSGTQPDLSMVLVDVPQAVCQAIDVISGIGQTIPTGAALTTVTAFDGSTYGAATAVTLTTNPVTHAFCYQESTGGKRYIYVNVIRAR